MSIQTDIFHAEREINHDEHQYLLEELAELELVVDQLSGPLRANPSKPIDELRRVQRRLSERLPAHFALEEATVLASVAELGPDMKHFARQMKRQHNNLRRQLELLVQMTEAVAFATQPNGAVAEIQQHGHQFAQRMMLHMTAEEKMISQFYD